MEIKYLLRNSLDSDYKNKIDIIESQVKPLLSRTTNANVSYTEHTLDHSLSIENLYAVCFPEVIDILNNDEKFLLIVATLVHDIGMVGKTQFIGDENYGEEVRSGHNYFSGDFIDEFKYDLGLENREAEAIKKIASGHRLVPLDSIDESEPYGQGGTIRVRLLSALIRLADELDILEERAPHLVKEYLGINADSLIHHERHEVMTGINRESSCINIKAVAYNKKLENAIIDMHNEILNKHTEVKQILSDNGIIIDTIKINIDALKVVSTELLLFIAEKDEATDEEIDSYFKGKRSPKDVRAVIVDLKSRKCILYNQGKFKLNQDLKFFKLFVELFIGRDDELRFTKSTYVNNFLKRNFIKFIQERFGVLFTEGDADDRIQVLTHFPTSLEYLLDDRNTPYESGSIDRRITLDLGLLHAVSIDAPKYPEEFEEEVFNSVLCIEKSLGENSVNYFRIMQGIAEVKKKQ